MGRGTVPVLAKHHFSEKTHCSLPRSFCQKFSSLQNAALSILTASSEKFKNLCHCHIATMQDSLPVGFLFAEITMLPQDEVSLYENALFKNPALEDFVMNKKIPQNASVSEFEENLPLTWRLFHTENDSLSSLTFSESALVFKKFLTRFQIFQFQSDNSSMSFKELFQILKAVFSSQIVIGTVIVVFLYMRFCSFVANYVKKPPKPKKKPRHSTPAPATRSNKEKETAESSEETE